VHRRNGGKRGRCVNDYRNLDYGRLNDDLIHRIHDLYRIFEEHDHIFYDHLHPQLASTKAVESISF
jgi:hypothetical protein